MARCTHMSERGVWIRTLFGDVTRLDLGRRFQGLLEDDAWLFWCSAAGFVAHMRLPIESLWLSPMTTVSLVGRVTFGELNDNDHQLNNRRIVFWRIATVYFHRPVRHTTFHATWKRWRHSTSHLSAPDFIASCHDRSSYPMAHHDAAMEHRRLARRLHHPPLHLPFVRPLAPKTWLQPFFAGTFSAQI